MQARPPVQPPAGKYHPPLPPRIPIQAIQSLIPRLSITIRDIDILKDQIAAGAQNGSMPNWDSLLLRYSILLGRINALSSYISSTIPQPTIPSISRNQHQQTPPSGPSLSNYLVHPLLPLPPPNSDQNINLNPLAGDTFFQVLNTQKLPEISEMQNTLLDPFLDDAVITVQETGENGNWVSLEVLKSIDSSRLEKIGERFRDRLRKESLRAAAVLLEIGRREEEVDWVMRIEEEEEEEDAEGEDDVLEVKGDDRVDEEVEEKDDLFDEDDDDDGGDHLMDGSIAPIPVSDGTKKDDGPVNVVQQLPNPRAGWGLNDYLKFMDTGSIPSAEGGQ